MRGSINLNGWIFEKKVQIKPGVIASHYRHRETGWRAQEIFQGSRNKRVGLLVTDETGKSVGLAQTVRDLP